MRTAQYKAYLCGSIYMLIVRMTCHLDFKCGSINFHKQRKQPEKYHLVGIAPLSKKYHFMQP